MKLNSNLFVTDQRSTANIYYLLIIINIRIINIRILLILIIINIRIKKKKKKKIDPSHGKCPFERTITGYLEYYVTEDQHRDVNPKIAIRHRQFRQYFAGRAVVAICNGTKQFFPVKIVHRENDSVQGILYIAYVTDVIHDARHMIKKNYET